MAAIPRLRSIKTAQLDQREIVVLLRGTLGTPDVQGPDRLQISSVVDLGAGNYTLILRKPAQYNKDVFLKGHGFQTADSAIQVTAVAFDRITIQCTDLAAAAKDADVYLTIGIDDSRFNF